MKQWISVLLAVVMLLALASCGTEPDAPAETSPSADSGGDSGTGSGEETDEWGQTVIDNEIPEDLDYTDVFEDVFQEYTASHDLVCVKTTNMGSMFRLTYHVTLRDITKEKEMIDKLRCRNGNLEISVSRQETAVAEL